MPRNIPILPVEDKWHGANRAIRSCLALANHDVDELSFDDNDLDDLLPFERCLNLLVSKRKLLDLVLGRVRRHRQTSANLPVDLNHDLDLVRLYERGIVLRPGMAKQGRSIFP